MVCVQKQNRREILPLLLSLMVFSQGQVLMDTSRVSSIARVIDSVRNTQILGDLYISECINQFSMYFTAYMKVWDSSVPDEAEKLKKPSNMSVWDGRKESNISFILEKHYGVKGLGTSG